MAYSNLPVLERFYNKIQKSNDPDGCWLWTGATKPTGYGNFGVSGRTVTAHRFAYEQFVGVIGDGLCVLHHCDNPSCVNPEHLFLGTQGDNMRDMTRKGRNTSQTHPERQHHGEHHHWTKLTTAQAHEIRRRYAAGGVSQPQLGKEFNVRHSTIGAIVRGENRRHE